jgi:acetyl esterase/lipase
MRTFPRRAAIAILFLAGSCLYAQNATNSSDQLSAFENKFGIQIIRLWDGDAPGAKGDEAIDIPTLTVFLPQPNTGNGTAVIIAPGGAHIHLANNLEGRQVANWFNARGVTAFVLTYRLGPKYLFPVPLWDAQRAMRLVRSRAKQFAIAPDRIGIMGFSAGGHLAALTGTLFDEPNPNAADAVDKESARPDFMVLGYPWLNAMQPRIQDFITYCSVLKISADQCGSFTQPFTPVLHVTAKTPPTFIYHTDNDKTVPVSTSVEFYTALHQAGVPAELHIFENGSHGSGLGKGDPVLDLWPSLLEAWMRGQGLLTASK